MVLKSLASVIGRRPKNIRRNHRRRRAEGSGGLGLQQLETRFAFAADSGLGSVPTPWPTATVQVPGLRPLLVADNAGNTTATARGISLGSSMSTFSDWVGSTDTNDYYRFTLPSTSTFNLSLTGLSADADVTLLNATGGVIASSTRSGTLAESMSRQISAGTYFIRVYPYSGSTSYLLGVSAIPVVPPDYAGNSLATARSVTVSASPARFQDWVGFADTDDYYKFSMPAASTFNLQLSGLNADADVRLLDATGSTIASSTNGGTSPESITSQLRSGTYYVRVNRFSGDSNYNLDLSATPLDGAGNTLDTARSIAIGATTSTYTDWVGSTDTLDYYRFSVPTGSNFRLTLSGLVSDADVRLLDNNGNVVASSTFGGTTPESIVRDIDAGTYYVVVYPYSGGTNYTLELSATQLIPPDFAGNSLSQARSISLGVATATFTDWVGSGDGDDYYRFSLTATSNVGLQLFGLIADADVAMLNSSGAVIGTSSNGGSAAESLSLQLVAGTYYIRVYQYAGDTSYVLAGTAVPVAIPDGAGNSLANARNITVGSAVATFRDWVGGSDTQDYYRFSLSGASQLNASLGGLSADADIQLLDSNGAVIAQSTNAGTANELVSRTLTAGTYYLRVFQYFGDTAYDLSVSATAIVPADFAGNTLAAARRITVGSTPATFQDWVGAADTDDYYQFTLTTSADVSISLGGLVADADLTLLGGAGNVLSSSTAGGVTAESIARTLSPGSYAIRVYRYSGDTYYSLVVTATGSSPVPPNPTPGDWYDQNLRDAQNIALARTLAQDGSLSREDVISLFRNAADADVVDANELADLRTIVANSNRFLMTDAVRFLASAIANGNVANVNSGIGNLVVGSRTQQVELLVGKWFLGTDRPSTSYSYTYVAGSLFQNGPGADDIQQNGLGDCYFLATLSSIAQEKPAVIQSMFTDNGDNTWTVRFYHDGVAEYVTVDRYLPASSGFQVYAGWGGGAASSLTNELWVALAEKAYAQLVELGWSRSFVSANSYAAIAGGWMDKVIQQVAGLATTSMSAVSMTQSQLIGLVNSNQILTAGFVFGGGFGIVDSHAYSISSYNSSSGTFRLRNPWGTSHADVTFAQLQSLQAIIQWSNV